MVRIEPAVVPANSSSRFALGVGAANGQRLCLRVDVGVFEWDPFFGAHAGGGDEADGVAPLAQFDRDPLQLVVTHSLGASRRKMRLTSQRVLGVSRLAIHTSTSRVVT